MRNNTEKSNATTADTHRDVHMYMHRGGGGVRDPQKSGNYSVLERERERERERDRQTDRERQTETDRHRERERDRQRQKQTDACTNTHTQTHTHTLSNAVPYKMNVYCFSVVRQSKQLTDAHHCWPLDTYKSGRQKIVP